MHGISVNFPELSIIGKHVKIRLKNRGSPCYFLSSRGQKIKNITKIKQKRLFLFNFLVSSFMAFLLQKLIYAITIWFNFVFFGSFFEQDHLLNLFILGVYVKSDLNVHVFQYKNWLSPKFDRWFFFLTLTVRRVEAATGSHCIRGDSLQYIYPLPVTFDQGV